MKKKLFTAVTIIVAVAQMSAASVSAKIIGNSLTAHMMNNGYTLEEAIGSQVMKDMSREKMRERLIGLYQDYGNDWEMVAHEYDVDYKEFSAKYEEKLKNEVVIDIPDEIYREMQKKGMSDTECKSFVLSCQDFGFDLEETWTAVKNGKNFNELVEKESKKQNERLKEATALISGKIDKNEYEEMMKRISPEMTIGEILAFRANERKAWLESQRQSSGITDEEIAYAKEAGLTSFIDVCSMKRAEGSTTLTYEEMVDKVSKGREASDVIRDSLTEEKLNELYAAGE